MTIQSYTPDRLDQLAMRFFDLSAQLRSISRLARQQKLADIPVHDKKALQWCDNLEIWAKKTDMNFRIALQESKVDEFFDFSEE